MKNKKIAKAILPFILMGSPAVAMGGGSSVRTGSRFKVKKAVVEKKISKEEVQNNPFSAFTSKQTYKSNIDKDNVLSFLEQNGLLEDKKIKNSFISGDVIYRKEFAGKTCTGGPYAGYHCSEDNSCRPHVSDTWLCKDTSADTTAPTQSSISSANIAETTADIKATSDEDATMYYVVATSSSSPSADDVINNSVTNGVKNGNASVTANSAKTFSISGLTDDTTYYYYIVSKDSSDNKSSVGSDNFTTVASNTAPTITDTTSNQAVNDNATIKPFS